MQFVEAFNAIDYEVEVPRQDWSAQKTNGICLTLWSKETDWKALVMDTRLHAGPIEGWQHKPGNAKRILHARRALDEFDGWVDVVKIDGDPGEGYGNASPWNPHERMGRHWRITFLDDVTGHLRLEAHIKN
jgi:hypothetical protein